MGEAVRIEPLDGDSLVITHGTARGLDRGTEQPVDPGTPDLIVGGPKPEIARYLLTVASAG